MAISSLSAALTPPSLIVCNSSTISTKPKLSSFSLPSNALKLKTLKPYHLPSTRVFAAPEVLDSQETLDGPDYATLEVEGSETPGSSPLSLGVDTDKMAPKQKIRIKLRSYWVPKIEDSCKQIMDAARTTNAKTMGPVPLPTKKRIYCVLKSPHVHKDARFHFEIRTHQRLIDILYPTAQTIDSLMQLDLPAGVDVEVKL
uniref:Small ribosomal subunit protein uS10c n=1 Tax=Davidia involucrata TaxID=16924 RepID=A0A5B6ZZQ4_DAVIN